MRELYQAPMAEEITYRLSKAKYFTVLDTSSGFWQLKLDEASSRLCTFNTPFGRYRILRVPFGVNSAPEVFHRTMTQLSHTAGHTHTHTSKNTHRHGHQHLNRTHLSHTFFFLWHLMQPPGV